MLRRQGRYEEALARLDAALGLPGDLPFARGTRGQVLAALGNEHDAIADLERAFAADPSLTWVLADLGEQLRLAGRLDEALVRLDEAVAATPRRPTPSVPAARCVGPSDSARGRWPICGRRPSSTSPDRGRRRGSSSRWPRCS